MDRTRSGVDLVALVARIAIAVLFIPSGFSKLMNLPGFITSMDGRGVPLAPVLAPLGAAIEFLGGLALLLGVQVRLAALLLVLFTAAATLISHRFWEFQDAARRLQETNFFKNLAIIGGLLFAAGQGGGRYCVERLWRRANPPHRR
jgi:putative oxidoreductase